MEDQPIVLTDPARELAELCERLRSDSGQAGEVHLAAQFEVEAWSREFFQIVFTISERCSLLKTIIVGLDLDEDVRAKIVGNVATVRQAFSATSMRTGWSSYGNARIGSVYVGPIKALSGLVRQQVAYRRLSGQEVADLGQQVDDLLDWLERHQLADQDFIRQALIEGLGQLRFRLERLGWLGWGYTLDSLREVLAAYMLLERGGVDPASNPEAAAVLQKVGAVVRAVYERVTVAKNVTDGGDWLIKAYGVGSLVYQTGKPLIAGLLS